MLWHPSGSNLVHSEVPPQDSEHCRTRNPCMVISFLHSQASIFIQVPLTYSHQYICVNGHGLSRDARYQLTLTKFFVCLYPLFWHSENCALRYILIIKPTRCTNFSNLFLEYNSTRFRQFLCPSSGVLYCTHSKGICYTGFLTACEQDQDGTGPSWSCSQAVSKPVWHIPLLCVHWKTTDDGYRNCLKCEVLFQK